MEFISHSLNDTDDIAKNIASKIKPNDIITLDGNLGTGKTTFTKFFVKHLGSNDLVSSPTFSLVNHYNSKCDIFHFDMYRIATEDDLYSIGFFDYLDNNNILIIEWSENIKPFLPLNSINITFEYIDDNSRKIIIKSKGDDNF